MVWKEEKNLQNVMRKNLLGSEALPYGQGAPHLGIWNSFEL